MFILLTTSILLLLQMDIFLRVYLIKLYNPLNAIYETNKIRYIRLAYPNLF